MGIAAPELLDRIVATIDDEVILLSELNQRVQFEIVESGSASIREDQLAVQRAAALESMIDEQIVVLMARNDSIALEPGQVEKLVSDEMHRIKSGMDAHQLTMMLKRTGFSERALRNRYRRQIQHQLLYEKMLNRLSYRVFVSRKDIEAYRQTYADSLPPKVSMSQITVKVLPSEEELAVGLDRIVAIQEKIESGADFADAARRLSDDRRTAPDGGYLGCFAPGALMREFGEIADGLRPGEISRPFFTKHGVHLMLLQEKREDEFCASHILASVETTAADRERALGVLHDLRQRVVSGKEDFGSLARQYSHDSGSAQKGGLWRVLERDSISPSLLSNFTNPRLGDTSQPFLQGDEARILRINGDAYTLQAMVREDRFRELMRNAIDEFKQGIHIKNRLDDSFLRRPRGSERHPSMPLAGMLTG